MRHLALLLVLPLLFCVPATSAHAAPPPVRLLPTGALPGAAAAEVEEAEEEEEEEEVEEGDECTSEEVQLCPEIANGDKETEEANACVLEGTSASVDANHRGNRVRLIIRYAATEAAFVLLDYSLRGGKGGLDLGSARAHFKATGVFHDSLTLPPRDSAKLLAAHQFTVALHAVGSPGRCRERVVAQRRSPRKLLWS